MAEQLIRVNWRGKFIGYADSYDEALDMMEEHRITIFESFQWKPIYVEVSVKLPRWIAERLRSWGWVK